MSIAGSVIGGIILLILGKWQGWWWRSKKPASIDLATSVLKLLDGEAEEKTNKMIYATKQLGDSLVT